MKSNRSLQLVQALVVLSITALIGLAGCGGSGSGVSGPTGRLTMTIHWPDPSRLIPNLSNYIEVYITQTSFASITAATNPNLAAGDRKQVVARPEGSSPSISTVEFLNLPEGNWTVVARGFPTGTEGDPGTVSGVAQSFGKDQITIVASEQTPFSVTMESTLRKMHVALQEYGQTATSRVLTLAANGNPVDGTTFTFSDANSVTVTITPQNINDGTLVLDNNIGGEEIELTAAVPLVLGPVVKNANGTVTTTLTASAKTSGNTTVYFRIFYREGNNKEFRLPIDVD